MNLARTFKTRFKKSKICFFSINKLFLHKTEYRIKEMSMVKLGNNPQPKFHQKSFSALWILAVFLPQMIAPGIVIPKPPIINSTPAIDPGDGVR